MGIIHISDEGSLRICAKSESGGVVFTDASKEDGGVGEHLAPTDLLGVALAHCILTVLSILAKRMKVDIGHPTATMEKSSTAQPPIRITKIAIQIKVPTAPDEAVRRQLEEKASIYCPVSLALHPDLEKEIRFSWGQ